MLARFWLFPLSLYPAPGRVMSDLLGLPAGLIVNGMLGLYALAYLAGGIYYLEQRVARIRDQFPQRAPLAWLTGLASLGIGILSAAVALGHLLHPSPVYRLGVFVATLAGFAFWILRMNIDLTPLSRLRDGAMAFVCGALALIARWWMVAG
jgi:hypothetical protein